MPDANTRIDSLREDVQVIGDMVLDLQAKVASHDRRFDQIDARLAGHDSRFDGVDTRLDRIETRLDGHDARFDHVDAQLAEILTRLPQRPGNGESANS